MSAIYGNEIVHYCLACGKRIDFTKPNLFTFAGTYILDEYVHFACDWDEEDEMILRRQIMEKAELLPIEIEYDTFVWLKRAIHIIKMEGTI